MLSTTPVQLRVQNSDSLESTWSGENDCRERKTLFQQKALVLPWYWGTKDPHLQIWSYSPVTLLPRDEPKNLLPKSIVGAYTVYRPLMEIDRNSPDFLPVCFCLLSPMNSCGSCSDESVLFSGCCSACFLTLTRWLPHCIYASHDILWQFLLQKLLTEEELMFRLLGWLA